MTTCDSCSPAEERFFRHRVTEYTEKQNMSFLRQLRASVVEKNAKPA